MKFWRKRKKSTGRYRSGHSRTVPCSTSAVFHLSTNILTGLWSNRELNTAFIYSSDLRPARLCYQELQRGKSGSGGGSALAAGRDISLSNVHNITDSIALEKLHFHWLFCFWTLEKVREVNWIDKIEQSSILRGVHVNVRKLSCQEGVWVFGSKVQVSDPTQFWQLLQHWSKTDFWSLFSFLFFLIVLISPFNCDAVQPLTWKFLRLCGHARVWSLCFVSVSML